MNTKQRTVTWIGGPQDGATVLIPATATWVTVLEDRSQPTGQPTQKRSLVRYSVPVINNRIIWSQRVEADPDAPDPNEKVQ